MIDTRKPVIFPSHTRAKAIVEAAHLEVARVMDPPAGWTTKLGFALNPQQLKKALIVSRYQQNAYAEVFSAYYTGLNLAIACTTTQLESGGRNVYGADPASAWMNGGPYGSLWGHNVTKDSYQWFGAKVDQGFTSNGVGPKQLTSRGLQRAADARGGCWVPQHNMATGDRFFQSLLAQSNNSLWTAAFHYNGSGPAAQNYANMFIGIYDTWRVRLGL